MSNGMIAVPRSLLERALTELDELRGMVEFGPTGVDAEIREILSSPEPTILADDVYRAAVLGDDFDSAEFPNVFNKGFNTLEQIDGKYLVKMAFDRSDDALPAFKEICRLSEQ
ncbi:hypothetical protein D3C75_854610 [compost metagenome]